MAERLYCLQRVRLIAADLVDMSIGIAGGVNIWQVSVPDTPTKNHYEPNAALACLSA
jgi:hypothetical protein